MEEKQFILVTLASPFEIQKGELQITLYLLTCIVP